MQARGHDNAACAASDGAGGGRRAVGGGPLVVRWDRGLLESGGVGWGGRKLKLKKIRVQRRKRGRVRGGRRVGPRSTWEARVSGGGGGGGGFGGVG